MRLRLDIRVPSLPGAERRALEAAFEQVRVPPGEIWVVSVIESAPDEWLLLLTGGGEREVFSHDWSFVAVEESERGERVCTYARRIPAGEHSPAGMARSVDQLLRAAGPARAPGEPA
ncbi:MAG TPA: hypothetical protein VF310_15155 [Vicinamibacteria bacterium]